MIYNYKQNALRKIMIKKRKEKEEIKKIESQQMIDNVHIKMQQTIKVEDLPF